ncbi:MAG: peptidylprolyl isomerase [Cypionkella sp.]|nr:peptidylprolyl isomerase [Cypionkella sp.]
MAKSHLFLAAMAAAVALSAPALAQDVTAATVVARVNGTEITVGHLIAARDALPEQYKALPDETLFKGVMDQLIQQSALQQSVEGKLKTRDQLALDNMRRDYMANVALTEVVMNVVTEEALQTAYDEKFKEFAPQTEYSAAHILVAEEARAKELLAELEGGADFATLAKANSTDTGSGANGGELGWFGLGQMVKPFEDAVVAAQIGKVAGPVKSDFGYHLILVKETRIAEKPSLDQMREELSSDLQNRAIGAHIKSVTEAATVERLGDGIDPSVLSNSALLDK